MRTAFVAMLLLVLASCSVSNTIEKGLSAQERATIRGAIGDISRGDSAALARRMPPELLAKIPAAELAMNRAMPTPPLEVSLLNAEWSITGPNRTANAVYQVHGRSGWAIVEAHTSTFRGRTSLTGIFVRRVPSDPRSLNGLDAQKAGVTHFAMISLMVAAAAVTVAALFRIWRSGLFQRRWLWTIGALNGVMTLRLDWTTGHLFFQPFSVQLFSVSATKQPIFAPWVLGVSIPLVASIVLFRHRAQDDASAEADAV